MTERPDIQSGDRVRVTGGPLQGLDGYVMGVLYEQDEGAYHYEVRVKVSWSDDPVKILHPSQWVQRL